MHLQNKRKCHKEYFDWHHNGRLMLKASLPNNGMDFQWSQTLHFFNDQFMWEKAPNLKILNTDITAGWEVTENSLTGMTQISNIPSVAKLEWQSPRSTFRRMAKTCHRSPIWFGKSVSAPPKNMLMSFCILIFHVWVGVFVAPTVMERRQTIRNGHPTAGIRCSPFLWESSSWFRKCTTCKFSTKNLIPRFVNVILCYGVSLCFPISLCYGVI